MGKSRMILLAGLIGVVVGGQILYTILLSRPDGIRIQWPEAGVTVGQSLQVAGDAWMAPGIGSVADIEVLATPVGLQDVDPIRVEGRLLYVKDRGRPIFPIHLWRADLELPAAGVWSVRATARSGDGRIVDSGIRQFRASPIPPSEFSSWSPEHLVALALICLLVLALAIAARRGGEAFIRKIAPLYAIIILGNDIAYQAYWFRIGAWSPATALMIQMCGLSILFIPCILMMGPGMLRDRLSELFYFWGIGGAIQALIAPDVGVHGFPSFRFIDFFVSHGLIIAGTAALVAAGRVRITLASLGRCFLATNLVLVPVWVINRLLVLVPPYVPGNYFILSYPPPMGSIVDLFAEAFGPAPRYLIGLELMGLAIFGLLWLPWAIARPFTAGARVRRRSRPNGA